MCHSTSELHKECIENLLKCREEKALIRNLTGREVISTETLRIITNTMSIKFYRINAAIGQKYFIIKTMSATEGILKKL